MLDNDACNVDFSPQVLGGQVMEQGPVLLIQFHAHQIECWRDFKNEVVVGSPVSIHIHKYSVSHNRRIKFVQTVIPWVRVGPLTV